MRYFACSHKNCVPARERCMNVRRILAQIRILYNTYCIQYMLLCTLYCTVCTQLREYGILALYAQTPRPKKGAADRHRAAFIAAGLYYTAILVYRESILVALAAQSRAVIKYFIHNKYNDA